MQLLAETEALVMAAAGHAFLAGRLEADAELAALWRAQVAIVEAARSAWLDGHAVSESEIVGLAFDERPVEADPHGLRLAEKVLASLRQPPQLDGQGLVTLDTRGAREVMIGADGLEIAGEDPDEIGQRRRLQLGVVERLDAARLPVILKVVIAAQLWAFLQRGALAGAGHRLMMIAAEHRWARTDPFLRRAARQAGGWIWAPSAATLALPSSGWNPSSPGFPARLFSQLAQWSAGQAQAIAELAEWRRAALEAFTGRRSTSRKRDFVSLLFRRPIVTARDVAGQLEISGTAARNLISEAESLGLVVEISGRASWRVHATPFLAKLRRPLLRPAMKLGQRLPSPASGGDAAGPVEQALGRLPAAPPRDPEEMRKTFDKVFREIDEAMQAADLAGSRAREVLRELADEERTRSEAVEWEAP